ncbi:MAG: hypothetical protein L6V91_07520 [Bacilli bacterium]|nr:MAG: hypothetical protein L6V91_07520 [Bacilli bacterium]
MIIFLYLFFLLGDHWHNKEDGYTPSISMKNVSEYLNRNNIKLGVTVNPDFFNY